MPPGVKKALSKTLNSMPQSTVTVLDHALPPNVRFMATVEGMSRVRVTFCLIAWNSSDAILCTVPSSAQNSGNVEYTSTFKISTSALWPQLIPECTCNAPQASVLTVQCTQYRTFIQLTQPS